MGLVFENNPGALQLVMASVCMIRNLLRPRAKARYRRRQRRIYLNSLRGAKMSSLYLVVTSVWSAICFGLQRKPDTDTDSVEFIVKVFVVRR